MNISDHIETERAFVSALFYGSNMRVIVDVFPEAFVDPKNRAAFEIARDQYLSLGKTDSTLWMFELHRRKLDSTVYDIGRPSDASTLARMVLDNCLDRRLGDRMRSLGEYTSGLDRYEALRSFVEEQERWLTGSKSDSSHDRFLESLEPSGKVAYFHIPIIDRYMGGAEPGDNIVIAARPRMGKTALAATLAWNAAFRDNRPVEVFSYEMDDWQFRRRVVANVAGVPVLKMKERKLHDTEKRMCIEASEKINKYPISFRNFAGRSLESLIAAIKTSPAEIVVVDYLQLIASGGKNENESITRVSQGINSAIKSCGKISLTLSQLNRESVSTDAAPGLHHLRGSGSIEQDANVVMFIHAGSELIDREDYQNILPVNVILAKNRDGLTGEMQLVFDKRYARFYEESDRKELF